MNEKKTLTDYQAAWLKAQKYCVYQERSQQEVRNKLYEWGMARKEVEILIAELISHNYINEERFALTLAGGKFRIKKWGKIKIKQALKMHQISDYCIKKALAQISEKDYENCIKQHIVKKWGKQSKKLSWEEEQKTYQFLYGKGFENDVVTRVLKDIKDGKT